MFSFADPKRHEKYSYYLTPELEEIVDYRTYNVVLSGIETCFTGNGPASNLKVNIARDGKTSRKDSYLNASGLAALFPAKAGDPENPKLKKFVEHKEFLHQVSRVVRLPDRNGAMVEDYQEEFHRIMKNIKALTSEQFLFIVNNALKLTAGVAVPVYYYKVVEDGGVLISPTRYLDHCKNLPEAQFKLANGLTTNRWWCVRPEHLKAYAVLEKEYDMAKALDADEKLDEPDFAVSFMAKLALERA